MRDDLREDLGTMLKNLRLSENYTQNDLAEIFIKYIGDGGVYQNENEGIRFISEDKTDNKSNEKINYRTDAFSDYEKGERILIPVLHAYADVFKVTVDYILGRAKDSEPTYKSIRETTGLNNGAVLALEKIHKYNDKEAVIKRMRLQGVSEKNFERKYKEYKEGLQHKNNPEISNVISYILCDIDFWVKFNDALNNILNMQKDSSKNERNIKDEKDDIKDSFETLLENCIEYFKGYNKRQKKLF